MSRRQTPTAFRTRPLPQGGAAGHRPLLLALAMATGFAGTAAQAQPTGAQAIHGSAVLSQQGSKLVVTTGNGAGSDHSAINWQSFSVPSGTTTHFAQPGVASTSINRVIGPDPSAIFGTLSSNGRLVLVNPAGIAVGAGAVVDTAGFTASTLRMSDADAMAGRLRFGDGSAAGALRVDGQVLARSGDVVLIGTDVQAGAQAVVQSPEGATVLAAGQKVELTGRGLEGILFELQAPGDRAVNLGTLRGDAVGVFAGTLRHSGLVQAQAVTVSGGRVVLQASDHAEAAGATQARGLSGAGGRVDVLGRTVGVMAGAVIDTSNANGGGRIRVGGDYQGGNAEVPNAQVTWVAPDAQLRANATDRGDGGTVIVWADDTTRAYGRIEARGGANGGDGGFVETSGKRHLDANGARVDASAPVGQAGTWLLDPTNVTIVAGAASGNSANLSGAPNFGSSDSTNSVLSEETLNMALDSGAANVTVATGSGAGAGDIVFDTNSGPMTIGRTSPGAVSLDLQAHNNIVFIGTSQVHFYADDSGGGPATLNVNFQPGSGSVLINGGTSVMASTTGSGNQVNLSLPTGVTLDNAGTLGLNLNARVNLAGGATLANNGQMFGSGGPNGGIGGAGTFRTSGNVIYSQGSITVDTLDHTAGSLNLGSGTDLSVTRSFHSANGTFEFQGNNLGLRQQTGDLVLGNGSSDIGASGNVMLQADAGSIQVLRNLHGSTLSMTASGNIDSVGFELSTYGTSAPGPFTIQLAAGGNITFGDIDTGGSPLHATGVSIDAGGHVGGQAIRSDGAYGSEGAGGNGGAVNIRAGSTVSVGTIDTAGGDSSLGARGGDAGAVTIDAGQSLTIGSLWGYGGGGGGANNTVGGAGGKGATVKLLQRSGDLGLSGSYVDLQGGYGGDGLSGGQGGQGGTLEVTASTGGVQMAAYDYLSVSGGGGGEAASATSNAGGTGGRGGSVFISAKGASALLGVLDASGGWGGDGDYSGSSRGGTGGTGGSILIDVAGPLQLAGWLGASGGYGGEVVDYESAYPYPMDATRAGSAGSGGTVVTRAGGGIVVPTPMPTSMPAFSPTSPTPAPSALEVSGAWTNEAELVLSQSTNVIASGPVTNRGSLRMGQGSSFVVGHAYDPAAGTYSFGGGTLTNASGALLDGNGTIVAHLANAGTVAPGGTGTVGTLTVTGDFSQQPTGVLQMDIAADPTYVPGLTYDQLLVHGSATLGGQLQLAAVPATTAGPTASMLVAGATQLVAASPAPTTYYELLSAGSASGEFSLISGPSELVTQIRMNVGGTALPVPGYTALPSPSATVTPIGDGLIAAIQEVLPGVSLEQIQQVVTESQNNAIATQPLPDDEDEGKPEGSADIVVTDTACQPG